MAQIAEFTTSKFCTFNDFFFHFLGLNWSLNDVKHTILVLQKQLISTKKFFICTHFAVGGKGAQNAYFHPSTVQKFPHLLNRIAFPTNKGNVQKHRNIKICCDLSDLSVQPIDEICLFSVSMTVFNRPLALRGHVTNASFKQ